MEYASSTYRNKLKICSRERRRILNALVTQGQQNRAKPLLLLLLRGHEEKEKVPDLIKKRLSILKKKKKNQLRKVGM